MHISKNLTTGKNNHLFVVVVVVVAFADATDRNHNLPVKEVELALKDTNLTEKTMNRVRSTVVAAVEHKSATKT